MKHVCAAFLLISVTLIGCAASENPYHTVTAQRRVSPDIAKTKHLAALEAIQLSDWDTAESLLREALTADVGFGPAHNNLGKVYFEQGKFYLAAWEFEYAIKLMPHHPEPRNNLALVLETVQRFDESIAQYEAALELQPDRPELLGNLARVKIRRGDSPQEIRQLLLDLILKDTRPDWRKWAEQELAKISIQ